MTTVEFHPDAREELAAAADFYEEQRPGLASSFLQRIRETLRTLEEHPSAGFEVEPGIRRLLVRGFPYSLLYELSEASALVLAVMHQHRRPGYWRSRRS